MISKTEEVSEGSEASCFGDSDKVWASLITNEAYLPGLLTLHYSLQKARSGYPLVALYTDSLPRYCLDAMRKRNIPLRRIDYLRPETTPAYEDDPRFTDCWTKLAAFRLTEYARVVLLDSDMLVLRNMDELMDLPLDDPEIAVCSGPFSSNGANGANGDWASRRVFAAGHACVCNPLHKKHYPADWVPENCAFTRMHGLADKAQISGLSSELSPLGNINSGLLVIRPSEGLFRQIAGYMEAHAARMVFPDQQVLSELFRGRWVALPYVYNALKTLREGGTHAAIWRDDRVKNVHYILEPKPWREVAESGARGGKRICETHKWWVEMDEEREAVETLEGLVDGR